MHLLLRPLSQWQQDFPFAAGDGFDNDDDEGITSLVAEQFAKSVLDVTDDAYVMDVRQDRRGGEAGGFARGRACAGRLPWLRRGAIAHVLARLARRRPPRIM